ncbi:MAG: hypothetical protein HXY41_18240 [Chloroflexi bacterium]|nr:hypothetical protein [Chloroflexota bacterium]
MSDAAATLIIAAMALFVAAIVGLIALASILRQRRNHMADRARAALQPIPIITAAAPQPSPRPTPKPSPRVSTPLPDYQRLPLQNGSPDQVVMFIEPVEGPTREQINVQKLIDFLKQETIKSNASPKAS